MPQSFQNISGVSASEGSVNVAGEVAGNVNINLFKTRDEPSAEAVCKALLLTHPRADRLSVTTAKGNRVAGTCEWVTHDNSYRVWLNSDEDGRNDNRLLWISGGPGKGKTMLAVYLTEELERHVAPLKNTELVFYFCSAQDDKRNTAVAVLRGLLYQILIKRPQLAKHAMEFYSANDSSQSKLLSFNSLWYIFSELIVDPKLGTMFCVLDGLDECDEVTVRDLLPGIARLLAGTESRPLSSPAMCKFKLVVISRDIPALQSWKRIRLDPDNDSKVSSDIELFVSTRVEELSRGVKFTQEFREHVHEALLNGANGTFLWVGFAMHELLKKHTPGEIQEALNNLPSGLPAMYSRMLLAIPVEQQAASCVILRWVLMAQRPLKVLELAEAVDFKTSHPLINLEQVTRDAIHYCKPLVEIQGEFVQLVHQSARDYMFQPDSSPDAPPKPFRMTLENAHTEIAQTCLEYITKNIIGSVSPAFGKGTCDGRYCFPQSNLFPQSNHFHLMLYAVSHWPTHVKSCPELNAKLLHRLEHFFHNNLLVRRIWWYLYNNFRGKTLDLEAPPTILPVLSILCYLDLVPLVQKILAWEWLRPKFLDRVNSRDNDGYTALHLAVVEASEALVLLLIDRGANMEARTKSGSTALSLAIDQGKVAMVQLLARNGANLEAKDLEGWSAIQRACTKRPGDPSIVTVLLDNGANVHERDHLGMTLLHQAVRHGSTAMTQVLLEKGANVNARDTFERSALHQAVSSGYTALAEMLLDAKANIDAQTLDGRTELHIAASGYAFGRYEQLKLPVLTLLLSRGASVSGKDQIRSDSTVSSN